MPFPPDTTYATLAEWRKRAGIADNNTDSDGIGQQLLNDAAYMVDSMSRDAQPGYEAFSPSASETRLFNDDMSASGIIEIDDCLSVTEVTRGQSVITPTYYQLYPYNPRGGPYTRLLLRADAIWPQIAVITPSSWYNYPYPGVGAAQIAVTGVWGYCTVVNRPPIVKEATLQIATLMYKQNALALSDVLSILQRDPTSFLTGPVSQRLEALRHDRGGLFA